MASSYNIYMLSYLKACIIIIWLVVSTPLKNISQLGIFFPIYGKKCSKPPTGNYSYGHLPVITGYKWDYTFYKWGYKDL